MVEFFSPNTQETLPKEELCVVYVLYFDEAQGHVPLMIYPIEWDDLKENKQFMRPIKYHPIWFLSEDKGEVDHIDLEFRNFTFFGKKILTKSRRKKKRAGLDTETPEKIVIIVSLPMEITIFGDNLINIMTNEINEKFHDLLFKIIESEQAKEEIIKTPKTKIRIEEGEEIKGELFYLIGKTLSDYFSKTIFQSKTDSLKHQEAFSYLALRGIDVSQMIDSNSDKTLSKSEVHDSSSETEKKFIESVLIKISAIKFIKESNEIEFLVLNNSENEINDIIVRITHESEFFEREILYHKLDYWLLHEELSFVFPIIPHIKDYYINIYDNIKKKKIFNRKINTEKLKMI